MANFALIIKSAPVNEARIRNIRKRTAEFICVLRHIFLFSIRFHPSISITFCNFYLFLDRLCGLVVRVLGYRSGGPGSIPGTTRKKSTGSGTGPHSLVSTSEGLLDRKVAAPV
jgi:hypothetical protein